MLAVAAEEQVGRGALVGRWPQEVCRSRRKGLACRAVWVGGRKCTDVECRVLKGWRACRPHRNALHSDMLGGASRP